MHAPRRTWPRPVHGEFLFPQHFLGFASLLRWVMRDLAVLFFHLLATVARLAGPGGARAVVAESVLVKQQLLILNRSRKRSPNLASLNASSPACARCSCARAGWSVPPSS
jgi:hypothetical protein